MSITDEVARLEAELREANAKLEHERRRADGTAGKLFESRSENAALREQLERVSKGHGELVQLFRTVYGTSERLTKEEQKLDAQESKPIAPAPRKLRDRLKLMTNGGEAA